MDIEALVNLALLNLGVSQSIEDIDEQSRAAVTAKQVYDHSLRIALRRFPWAFATKYSYPPQTAGPLWHTDPAIHTNVQAWDETYTYQASERLDGKVWTGDVVRLSGVNYYCILTNTNQQPPNASFWSTSEEDAHDQANGDWLYSVRHPTDCVYARRLVPPGGYGRHHNDQPLELRRHRDDNGLLLATNDSGVELEYTMVDCIDMWTDDLFLQYFAWVLAGKMSPSIERAQKSFLECHQFAEMAFRVAATVDINEAQRPKPVDTDSIRARR